MTDRFVVRKFRPAPWLLNNHLQTLYSPLFRRRPKIDWRRQAIAAPDGDEISLFRAQSLPTTGGRPIALLLHGLEGTLRSNYLPGLARECGRAGLQVAAFTFRSCDGLETHAPRLYHGGETTDLALVVRRLVEEDANRPIALVGVSLGGNVLLKWLGESAADVPEQVEAAVAISTPFDFVTSGPNIDKVLGGFYSWRFLRTLRRKALLKQKQHPELLDRDKLMACRTLEDFDTHATAALHGFIDARDYWAKVGSRQFLSAIERKTLLISAQDDPFNPASTLPHREVAENPWLESAFPKRGGHVGFVEGWPLFTRHWAEEEAARFLRHCFELA